MVVGPRRGMVYKDVRKCDKKGLEIFSRLCKIGVVLRTVLRK